MERNENIYLSLIELIFDLNLIDKYEVTWCLFIGPDMLDVRRCEKIEVTESIFYKIKLVVRKSEKLCSGQTLRFA